MDDLLAKLAQKSVSVRQRVSGKEVSTFAIGGLIRCLVEPQTVQELSEILRLLAAEGRSYKVLGAGSNILIPDEGMETCVIRLGRGLRSVTFSGRSVSVGGAASVMNLSRQAAKQGLSGLEFAGGIPASLGGAVFMNAGAHGGEFSSIVESVTILHPNGEMDELSAEEILFSYRRTMLPPSSIVVGAKLILVKSSPEEVERKRAENLAYRKLTQPLTVPCAGSIFKNPEGIELSAGALLERVGAKEAVVGGAQVSQLHANWIVNQLRTASAKDVQELIAKCQLLVKNAFGIALHPEIVMW
jgi:UDP-N-acetylmuramate dehydrogenase